VRTVWRDVDLKNIRSTFSSDKEFTVYFAASLKHIGEKAFLGCPLKEVAIPESVENLPDNAFDDGVVISR